MNRARHDYRYYMEVRKSPKKDDICDVIVKLQVINGYIYLKIQPLFD